MSHQRKNFLDWPSFLYMKKEMMHTHPLFIALLATTPMEDPREWTSEHAGHSSSESWRLITNPSTVQCAGDYHSRRKWRPHCCVIWVGFFTDSLKIRDFSSGEGLPTRKMARNSRWSTIYQVSKVLRNCYQSTNNEFHLPVNMATAVISWTYWRRHLGN